MEDDKNKGTEPNSEKEQKKEDNANSKKAYSGEQSSNKLSSDQIKNISRKINRRIKFDFVFLSLFFKWSFIAFIVGIIGGLIGTAFRWSVTYASQFRTAHPNLIWLLPIGGLLIAFLYRTCKLNEYTGTNLIIDEIRTDRKVPFALAPLIFVSTFITHLLGGSAGREGAALQLGGVIGHYVGRIFHLKQKSMSTVIICGMSAVFSALFGTPLTAAFFAMEVISVGIMQYSALFPSIVAALTAYKISLIFHSQPVFFELASVPDLGIKPMLQTVILAALCAGVSIIFCITMHKTENILITKIHNDYIRNFSGGAAILLLTFLLGTRDYNGAGMDVIQRAMNGQADSFAFLLKILFTAITIGSGFKGGEIVPAFFIGATFGCAAGKLLGMTPGFGAAIGLISVFCGAVNCPAASIFLSYEIFGGKGLLFFAVASSVSYVLSGYYGIYPSQRIVYSKYKAAFINIHAR